ncbi:hypothetical protein K1719_005334 [Acacia pycnantha]|nr:hypothetical protein K1719_005334 [Acacia pycnantha]
MRLVVDVGGAGPCRRWFNVSVMMSLTVISRIPGRASPAQRQRRRLVVDCYVQSSIGYVIGGGRGTRSNSGNKRALLENLLSPSPQIQNSNSSSSHITIRRKYRESARGINGVVLDLYDPYYSRHLEIGLSLCREVYAAENEPKTVGIWK